MGYAIMVEGFQAAKGSKTALDNGLALTRAWLGMVQGPPDFGHPLAGGNGKGASSTRLGQKPYGISAINASGTAVRAASGLAAWKFPVSQCAPFCHGTATDGDEDAVLGMIYLAEALDYPEDFVDLVIR